MNRHYNIALLARRLHLIATRPEFLNERQADRLDRALTGDAPGALTLPDAMLIIGASELDRMLGYAVAVMSRKGGRVAEVLDVLGMLNPDTICAVYYALPEKRRAVVTRDPVWAYHVAQLDQEEMREALAWAAEARAPAGPVVAALTRAVFRAAPDAAQAARADGSPVAGVGRVRADPGPSAARGERANEGGRMAKKGGNLGKVAIKPVNQTTLVQEPPRTGIAPFPKGGKTGH